MIKAVNLTKRFGEKTALDRLNVEIKDGCIYGLVGSNGSGKSTLLRLLSGVYFEDGGSLSIDGYSVWNNPQMKKQIFYLPDTPYFFKNASLKEMAAFYEGLYESFDMDRFKSLSEVFPISLTDRIENMSKGMQRQAALLLALSVNPKYLFLDEAFDGLDPVMRGVLKQLLIDSIEKTGLTVIIASHNLRELEDLCDHIALIHSGRLVFSDNIYSIKSNIHKVQAAYKAVPPQVKLAELKILKCERTGSLLQMVVSGDGEEIMAKINATEPLFAELVEPTLEEIFIYEMEAEGYDIKNMLA